MKILVDGDACPATGIIEKAAAELGVKVFFFHSTSHYSNMSHNGAVEIIMVDNVSQAVDMAIINKASEGDIVVTGDFGLASLALSKKAFAVSFNGKIYTDDNIDRLLFERHIASVIRRGGGRTKGPVKRSREDDLNFDKSIRFLIFKMHRKV
ncbi:MAG: YaiI/YqxD family protein [Caulobacteraceae bacterium]